jgi:hypothetical protein
MYWRPDQLAQLSLKRAVRQRLLQRLGHAEVDHLGHGLAVPLGHEHVRVLDVAVKYALAVRVL